VKSRALNNKKTERGIISRIVIVILKQKNGAVVSNLENSQRGRHSGDLGDFD
jgi:hypothetical protein